MSIDEESLGRLLPLVLDVNRLCSQPGGEDLVRALTLLAATSPSAFERLAPKMLGRVKHAMREVHGAPVIPLVRPRRRNGKA